MGFWSILFLLLTFVVLLFWVLYHSTYDIDTFRTAAVSFLICGLMLLVFLIDIPSAITGGETLYINSFPPNTQTLISQFIYTDKGMLVSYEGYQPDQFDSNGTYCIRYTKLTKSVLEIEKIN